LIPGVTAKQVERKLHIETRTQWTRRAAVDRLILADWTSESMPKPNDVNSKLLVLKVVRDTFSEYKKPLPKKIANVDKMSLFKSNLIPDG
jgi:hypothetical protein